MELPGFEWGDARFGGGEKGKKPILWARKALVVSPRHSRAAALGGIDLLSDGRLWYSH